MMNADLSLHDPFKTFNSQDSSKYDTFKTTGTGENSQEELNIPDTTMTNSATMILTGERVDQDAEDSVTETGDS